MELKAGTKLWWKTHSDCPESGWLKISVKEVHSRKFTIHFDGLAPHLEKQRQSIHEAIFGPVEYQFVWWQNRLTGKWCGLKSLTREHPTRITLREE